MMMMDGLFMLRMVWCAEVKNNQPIINCSCIYHQQRSYCSIIFFFYYHVVFSFFFFLLLALLRLSFRSSFSSFIIIIDYHHLLSSSFFFFILLLIIRHFSSFFFFFSQQFVHHGSCFSRQPCEFLSRKQHSRLLTNGTDRRCQRLYVTIETTIVSHVQFA